MENNLTIVIKCVTYCYMRNILNISLPQSLADMVREEVKGGEYASVSEFIRELIREWHEQKALMRLKRGELEIKSGKGEKLQSLRDLR